MADRQAYPPPVKCSATAKRTGQRCERWSIPGRLQCKLHGAHAGRAGKAAAEEKAGAEITIATMMANNPGRPVWEVIRDTIRAVDLLFQAAQNDVAAGQVSADSLDRMASLARQAHAMAASAVAAKALEMEAEAADRWGNQMADHLIVLIRDWLGLPLAGQAVVAAIEATMSDVSMDAKRAHVPAPNNPTLMDQVGRTVAAALASRFGLSAGPVAAWFAQVVRTVADGRPAPDLPGAPVAALPAAPAPAASVAPAAPALVAPLPEPAPPAVAELHSHDSKVAGSGDEAEEIEVVDAELIEPEQPETRPRRVTTQLGRRRAEPAFTPSYRIF